MEYRARVTGEPIQNFRVFLGGVVVEEGMTNPAGHRRPLDDVEELDELMVVVLLHTTIDCGAVGHMEGDEERGGRYAALLVVRHGSALAGLHRQSRLGLVEGRDPAFFVDCERYSMSPRAHSVAADILDLGHESGVVEVCQSVRLEAVGRPDALDGLERDPQSLGHRLPDPMGPEPGRVGVDQRATVEGIDTVPGLSCFVPKKTANALHSKELLPPAGGSADAGALGYGRRSPVKSLLLAGCTRLSGWLQSTKARFEAFTIGGVQRGVDRLGRLGKSTSQTTCNSSALHQCAPNIGIPLKEIKSIGCHLMCFRHAVWRG